MGDPVSAILSNFSGECLKKKNIRMENTVSATTDADKMYWSKT